MGNSTRQCTAGIDCGKHLQVTAVPCCTETNVEFRCQQVKRASAMSNYSVVADAKHQGQEQCKEYQSYFCAYCLSCVVLHFLQHRELSLQKLLYLYTCVFKSDKTGHRLESLITFFMPCGRSMTLGSCWGPTSILLNLQILLLWACMLCRVGLMHWSREC